MSSLVAGCRPNRYKRHKRHINRGMEVQEKLLAPPKNEIVNVIEIYGHLIQAHVGLKWLTTVSSTFQYLHIDGSIVPLFIC